MKAIQLTNPETITYYDYFTGEQINVSVTYYIISAVNIYFHSKTMHIIITKGIIEEGVFKSKWSDNHQITGNDFDNFCSNGVTELSILEKYKTDKNIDGTIVDI